MSARLSRVVLLMRDVKAGARFYGEQGVGLTTRFVAEEYAELAAVPPAKFGDASLKSASADHFALVLQQVEREADCSTGYSPILSFEVDDMDSTIQRIMMLGGRLDGPIKYPIEGKIASVRSPDGHMIGLFEANLDLV
mmetsp:Transcript_20209/g.39645  ORF Transcript_20209/g.39645 Transcript_20209/m.39645 type:complete len:138 (+) Transcript_20209:166-579(+)